MIISPFGFKTEHLLERKQEAKKELPVEYERRNKNLRILGFYGYKEYLKSEIWKRIRCLVLERDGHKCVICGKTANDVHHNSYELDVLVGKDLSQLVSLCRKHHKEIEFDENKLKRDLLGARNALVEKGITVPELKRSINVSYHTNERPRWKIEQARAIKRMGKRKRQGTRISLQQKKDRRERRRMKRKALRLLRLQKR